MKQYKKAKSLKVVVTDVIAVKAIMEATSAMMIHSLGIQYSKDVNVAELRKFLQPAYEKLVTALAEFSIQAEANDLFGLSVECFASLGYMTVRFNHEIATHIQPYNITLLSEDGMNWGLRAFTTTSTAEESAQKISSLRV